MLVAGGIGAGAGAVAAKVVDVGVTDEFVAQLREMVRAGTTTVAVLADHVDTDAVLAELHRFEGARYVAGNLPLAAIQAVRDALGDPAATTGRSFPPPADANRRPDPADRGSADPDEGSVRWAGGAARTPGLRRTVVPHAPPARPDRRRWHPPGAVDRPPGVTDPGGSQPAR